MSVIPQRKLSKICYEKILRKATYMITVIHIIIISENKTYKITLKFLSIVKVS